MHLGGLLSTQEARVAPGDYASFVLSNLPRVSITPRLHAARLPFLKSSSYSESQIQFSVCVCSVCIFCGSPSFLGKMNKYINLSVV